MSPRRRIIAPEFFTDAKVLQLNPTQRLLFIGLWTLADRVGVLADQPEDISIRILPRDPIDVDDVLDVMVALDLVTRYVVDGRGFVQIRNFLRYQKPHVSERASGFPLPSAQDSSKVHRPVHLRGVVTPGVGVGVGVEVGELPMSSTLDLPPPAAERIFAHWQKVCDHPRARLDGKRRRLIEQRLREGRPEADLMAAIEGCKASAFHQGENDRHAVFDDLTLILRDDAHVEQFMGYLNGKPSKAGPRAMTPDDLEKLYR